MNGHIFKFDLERHYLHQITEECDGPNRRASAMVPLLPWSAISDRGLRKRRPAVTDLLTALEVPPKEHCWRYPTESR
jgi:hypothetical protein